MKDFFIAMAFASIPISLFGFTAFLMYKDVTGWGWFLLCAVLISGSIRMITN